MLIYITIKTVHISLSKYLFQKLNYTEIHNIQFNYNINHLRTCVKIYYNQTVHISLNNYVFQKLNYTEIHIQFNYNINHLRSCVKIHYNQTVHISLSN